MYFVYEYVSNGTLSKLFKKFEKQRLPIELAVYYTAELITTLEYLHGKGIIHRDLKPQNILITSDYHLKIVGNISNKVYSVISVMRLSFKKGCNLRQTPILKASFLRRAPFVGRHSMSAPKC